MAKKVKELVLSKRTRLEFVNLCDCAQIELAANELERLVMTRFAGKTDPDQAVDVYFDLKESAKGFSVKAAENALIFSAPTALEIIYAVYDFAEEYLGYTFFEPGVDNLDEFGGKVALPTTGYLIRNRVPALEIRGFVQEFPFSSEESYIIADWMVKNKLNYIQTWMKYYDELDEDMIEIHKVRGITIEAGHHNFSYLIPAEKYATSHPEFFAEIGGKRINPSSSKSELLLSEQLCTTNPALREELVKNLIEYGKAHPEVTHVGLNPNDGFGWCECAECSKFYDKNRKGELYSLAEHVYLAGEIFHDLLRYVNRRLREEGSKLNVTFCAYINYCYPTEGMYLDEGLSVAMATYWRCINHTINDPDCPVNSRYAQDIANWCKVKRGGKMMIYEYFMGVNFYLSLPMIHIDRIFEEVQWYQKTGVDGLITQFHLPHWSVYGINYYTMANAMYGKKRAAVQKRMFKALFNEDAAEAKRFLNKMDKLMLAAGKCHIPYPYSLFSRTELKDYQKMHKLAVKLYEKLPRDDFRRDWVLWTEYLVRFKSFFDDYHAGKAGIKELKAFRKWMEKTCAKGNVVVVDKFISYTDQILDSIASGKKWIHFGLDWEDAYIIKHHEGILSKNA
ncbi:MAG: DUF4838 domain-containing protein [Lentisphaerae bacterium]|nr:DUF4838 domain-containing protein [Lentisphaerota bacterium]